MWNSLILIFIGGGLGSVLRFIIGHYVSKKVESGIPWGTLIVNILGSFLLGAIIGYVDKMNWTSSQYIVFFTIGFCGGFTTFSTFSIENAMLIKNGDWVLFLSYTLLSIIIGILTAFGGFLLLKG